ncbi:Ig-like domain repeat protein [Methanosphaera sp. ISO3-F5]|uniref:Ig-like domain repeat protein n=1 Tax=Methanosphaera sp. ISO3-F5 TaxID=1452353 RepID=UPI002B25C669|nr:Ig-like domain repeat protein [Methanosphaera sp. ISO3-F5]WQH64370.1 hypothetical protein PXD04_00820 [Methanosphaera sp. ISO3-F5]
MIHKKIFLMTLIIALIASLSMISATDVSNNDTTTTITADQTSPNNNDNIQDTPQTPKTINKNIQTNTKEATETVTNYEELYQKLTDKNAAEDTTINLGGEEETYTITQTINVSQTIKNLKIEGNGKTIDGQDKNEFLNIIHVCNLTINNLTIQSCMPNTETFEEKASGAIVSRYGNVNINNTRMYNNGGITAGALYIEAYPDLDDEGNEIYTGEHVYNVSITNSEFRNNAALFGGSAVHYVGTNGSNLLIDNCIFNGNGADQYGFLVGGALSLNSNGTIRITNSEFNSNQGSMGGAIALWNNGKTTIANTTFYKNNGTMSGGALYLANDGDINFENIEFMSNEAEIGGAINVDSTKDLTLTNITFISNRATGGGAINTVNENGTTKISKSTFIDNAGDIGAAILIAIANDSNLEISDSNFTGNGYPENYGLTSYGGAIRITSGNNTAVTLLNSNFTLNKVQEGSVISYEGENNNKIIIDDCLIASNGYKPHYSPSESGAVTISANENTTLSITNTNFTENLAKEGAAINYYGENNTQINITDSIFDSNGNPRSQPSEAGGAMKIVIEGDSSTTIKNSDFIKNKATRGGALYLECDGNNDLVVDNSTFIANGLGIYPYYTEFGGALYLPSMNDVTINNSVFDHNYASNGGALYLESEEGNVIIDNTKFNANSLPNNSMMETEAAIRIRNSGNTSIMNSEISNHTGDEGAALYYEGSLEENSTFIIDNVNFTSNNASDDGSILLSEGNVTINNSNFINNKIAPSEGIYYMGMSGALYSSSTILSIDNSNFIGNGLPETVELWMEDLYCEGSAIYHYGENLTITNSNFTSNIGGGEGHVIVYDAPSDCVLKVNNTIFDKNINYNSGESIIAPGICIYGNAVIDHARFSSNQAILENPYDLEESRGVIYISGGSEYTCNVTNTEFYNNSPENFFINDTDKMIYISEFDGEKMYDEYVPDYANVTVYIDESSNGIKTFLNITNKTDNRTEETRYYDRIEGIVVDPDNYLYKIVITQNNASQYYGKQDYISNTYYFLLPHDYMLTVNATSPVKVGDDTTIKGRAYYTKSNGEDVVFADKPVDLYINGTYIATTNTDSNGEYEFNYTTTTLGTQNVTVAFNKTYYLPQLTNTTTFDVIIRESVLNIVATNNTIGEKTRIMFNLTDTDGKKIANASIRFYVDDKPANITTDKNGIGYYECEINATGENYVLAFYDGNYSYTDVINSTIFHIKKMNTTVTITATNTTVYDKTTITGKLTDITGKVIGNAPITVYVDDYTFNIKTGADGEFKLVTTTNITGENHAAVIYEGNDVYMDSFNKTAFNVEKLNTKITVTAKNATVGETITITGTLTDQTGKNVKDAPVILYIDEEKADLKTSSTGSFTYTYKTVHVGDNYVEVFYEGNNINKDSFNTTTFNVAKINTTTTVKVTNTQVDNVTFEVKVNGKDGKTIVNGTLIVYDEKGKVISAHNIEDTESITIADMTSGKHSFTVKYEGNDTYNPSTTTTNVTVTKVNTKVTVDPVNGIIGEQITLTAHVTDVNGNPVSGGNLVFKLNGKTLRTDGRFDSNASAWKFQVKDGIASITINADMYLRNAKNLTASYSGSYKYNEAKSTVVTAQIKKREAKITVTTSPKTQKQYNTIKFTAKLTDTTKNYKNTTMMHTGTKVLFKINGKTIKNKNGKNLLVKVGSDNTATYKYTVPAGMGGVTKDGQVRDYTVEAVLVSDNYYPDTRNTTTFNVKRSSVTIDIAKTSINNKNVLNVQATIKDYKGKNVIGTNNVAIKINGKTYVNPKTNKTQTFKVSNGKINLKNIQVKQDIKVKKVMIVTGARQAYLGARNETNNIVKA